MMTPQCPSDAEIAAGIASRDESILEHLESCEACRDASIAAEFMEQLSGTPLVEHPVPDPALIWLKAQLLRTQAAEQRASERIIWTQSLTYGFVAISWATLLSLKWKAILLLFTTLDLAHLLRPGSLAAGSMSLIYILAALVGVTLVVTLHTALAEE
jgi:hypothetical protein